MLHTIVFADRALETKNAQVTGDKQDFDGRLKHIKRERYEQRSETNEQSDQHMLYPFVLVVQKVTFLLENAEGRFPKPCFPM